MSDQPIEQDDPMTSNINDSIMSAEAHGEDGPQNNTIEGPSATQDGRMDISEHTNQSRIEASVVPDERSPVEENMETDGPLEEPEQSHQQGGPVGEISGEPDVPVTNHGPAQMENDEDDEVMNEDNDPTDNHERATPDIAEEEEDESNQNSNSEPVPFQDPLVDTPATPDIATENAGMSEPTPLPSAETDSDTRINIVVKDRHNNEVHFKIKPSAKLEKLMLRFCETMRITRTTTRFFFEDTLLLPQHTPDEVGLEDGGCIDVHQEQIGGGH